MTYRDDPLYLAEMRDSGRAGGPQALFPDGSPPCAPDCSCQVSRYTTPAADALALMASSLLGPIEQSEPEERGHGRESSIPAMTPAPTDAEWYAEAEGDPLWARFLDGDR
jgi:hypothetical protein